MESSSPIRDLRSFLLKLQENDELLRVVEPVHWKYELGRITRETNRMLDHAPALLFENIVDYPGLRVLTNALGSYSRIAMAVGLNGDTSFRNLVKILSDRITSPVKPILSGSRLIKDKIAIGENVDLFALPVPWWNKQDGGRYIGTWHINISKDPENGLRNLGVYRMQLKDRNTTTVSVSPQSHLAVHINKSRKIGQVLPMAVAIGCSESTVMAAAAAPPKGSDELDLAGAFQQAPVELVKCRTIDLEVPAATEIVLEGAISPNEFEKDGPFVDYAGVPTINLHANVFHVNCVIYESNLIFRGTAIGDPDNEEVRLLSVLSQLKLIDFHGSRIRQIVQNFLLQRRYFRAFQISGKISQLFKSTKAISQNSSD